eukprot:gb/GEZJ01005185.1/.p1 GENE.gb/GEZJ01005185.1/~~gb/GEZJ01005185.1/.p1  ORF type:complete len:108 (+),score=11.20 gb/GEZJ01005185.1/:172-495(+)
MRQSLTIEHNREGYQIFNEDADDEVEKAERATKTRRRAINYLGSINNSLLRHEHRQTAKKWRTERKANSYSILKIETPQASSVTTISELTSERMSIKIGSRNGNVKH